MRAGVMVGYLPQDDADGRKPGRTPATPERQDPAEEVVVSLDTAVGSGGGHMSQGSRVDRGLLGRDRDVGRVEQYVASLSTVGSVLLVTGEPGVGKSVLLDVAEDLADGRARVLRCAGSEFEGEVAYSSLHQALRPLRKEIRRLDETPRSALQVALGLSVASPQEPLVVANAVLELLEQVAADQPLLIVVDDAQWLDRATAFALVFVGRRLAGVRVGLLVAARTGADNVFQALRVARHELLPLDDRAAAELLAARFPALDPRHRARLVAEARGNPLALLELPVRLAGSDPGAGDLPATLPLTERLQAVFAARFDELAQQTREILLLAALDGTGRLDVLQSAAEARGDLESLGSAERAQLLVVDDATRSVRFRHPLVRAAVVGVSTHAERRHAHQSLAEVFRDEPDRHVWHLAAAATAPDPAVALLLEQAARRSLRRGDGIGAVTTLIRSADLSLVVSERSRRLAEAAYISASLSGRLDSIAPLLEGARSSDASPSARLYATVAAAKLLFDGRGEIETAHRMLMSGIDAHAGSWDEHDDAVDAALGLLASMSSFLLTPEAWRPFRAAMARLQRPSGDLLLLADLLCDPARASGESLRRLRAELEDLGEERDPWRVAKLCGAGMFVDGRLPGPEPLLRILRRAEDEDVAPMMIIHAHYWAAAHHYRTGEWQLAHRHVDEGRRLCATFEFASETWLLHDLRMLLAAAEGDDELVTVLDEEGAAWAGPRRAHGVLHALHQAAGLGALGRGDYDTAFQRLALISPPGVLVPHASRALTTCMDLVEAAVRSGRRAKAAAHVAVLEESRIAAVSPRLAMLVAASAALAGEDDAAAVAAFERALALPGIDQWPFDHARVQLALGERLRRARAMSDARIPLRTAAATFERIGARPWAERARTELLATGETRAGQGNGSHPELTAQERQVAELAASGLTNREIGARLYLSHRTVGSHLHHVFPKLGITSRAALRDALNRTPGADFDR